MNGDEWTWLAVVFVVVFCIVGVVESRGKENEAEVVQALVTAEWCGSCKQIEPYVSKLKEKGELWRWDFDKHREHCKKYGVEVVPTLIVWEKRDGCWYWCWFVGVDAIRRYATDD